MKIIWFMIRQRHDHSGNDLTLRLASKIYDLIMLLQFIQHAPWNRGTRRCFDTWRTLCRSCNSSVCKQKGAKYINQYMIERLRATEIMYTHSEDLRKCFRLSGWELLRAPTHWQHAANKSSSLTAVCPKPSHRLQTGRTAHSTCVRRHHANAWLSRLRASCAAPPGGDVAAAFQVRSRAFRRSSLSGRDRSRASASEVFETRATKYLSRRK